MDEVVRGVWGRLIEKYTQYWNERESWCPDDREDKDSDFYWNLLVFQTRYPKWFFYSFNKVNKSNTNLLRIRDRLENNDLINFYPKLLITEHNAIHRKLSNNSD